MYFGFMQCKVSRTAKKRKNKKNLLLIAFFASFNQQPARGHRADFTSDEFYSSSFFYYRAQTCIHILKLAFWCKIQNYTYDLILNTFHLKIKILSHGQNNVSQYWRSITWFGPKSYSRRVLEKLHISKKSHHVCVMCIRYS